MKYLLYFLIVAIVFNCPFATAQIIVFAPERPPPLVEDYEKALSHFKKIESATFTGGYKDLKLVVKSTKEEKKLSDLSTKEQVVFILDLAEKQTKLMAALQKAWDQELKKFDKPDYNPKIEGEEKPALKADVDKYNSQLLDLRKKYAIAYEAFAEKTLREFNELDKKEIEFTLNQVRYFHDNEKLIERKKE